jgi:hypothetical protein
MGGDDDRDLPDLVDCTAPGARGDPLLPVRQIPTHDVSVDAVDALRQLVEPDLAYRSTFARLEGVGGMRDRVSLEVEDRHRLRGR